MKYSRSVKVFEHEYLKIGEHDFFEHHWKKLAWYNEQHGGRFFTLTPKGIKFNQYVGVIQVGNLTIEILPKINKKQQDSDKTTWQRILIEMLRCCHFMQIHSHEKATLKFKAAPGKVKKKRNS
jgi:5-methylcytosine-specific restriction enzyme subunit McrC